MAVTDPFVERLRPTLLPALLLHVARAYGSLAVRKATRRAPRPLQRLSWHELADIGLHTRSDLDRLRSRR